MNNLTEEKMKTMIKILCLVLSLTLVSCQGTWLMYDAGQKGRLYFEVLPAPEQVSFALVNDETLEVTAKVRLMGMPKDYDRTFHVEYIPAEEGETYNNGSNDFPVLTAREGTDFSIAGFVIPAGAVEADVDITLMKSEEMADNYIKLTFSVVEDEEFLPMDPDSTDLKAILSPQYSLMVNAGEPACPYWWDASSSGSDLFGWTMYLGRFYPDKFRKMLEFYHQIEEKNPSLYEQLVVQYGENLDKEGLSQSFFAQEAPAMWATYVLIPLYDYYLEYYSEHPDDPNFETQASSGTSGSYWRNPLSLLR